MGDQEAQASAAMPTAPWGCWDRCLGGRGPGTSVTGLGPPIRPFIGAHSWAVGLPKGSHSGAGPGTAGAFGAGPGAASTKDGPNGVCM